MRLRTQDLWSLGPVQALKPLSFLGVSAFLFIKKTTTISSTMHLSLVQFFLPRHLWNSQWVPASGLKFVAITGGHRATCLNGDRAGCSQCTSQGSRSSQDTFVQSLDRLQAPESHLPLSPESMSPLHSDFVMNFTSSLPPPLWAPKHE